MYNTNKIKIKQLHKETNKLIKIWDSVSEASVYISEENSASIQAVKSNISQCIREKRKYCQGYKWEYY